MHVHTPFPYLANGWADCGHFFVARDPINKSFTQVRDGMHLHVRTCSPLFHISRTVWRIVLKFVVWLGAHSTSLTQVRCGAHLHVHTCTPLLHDGAFAVARSSPIKAPYRYRCDRFRLRLISSRTAGRRTSSTANLTRLYEHQSHPHSVCVTNLASVCLGSRRCRPLESTSKNVPTCATQTFLLSNCLKLLAFQMPTYTRNSGISMSSRGWIFISGRAMPFLFSIANLSTFYVYKYLNKGPFPNH